MKIYLIKNTEKTYSFNFHFLVISQRFFYITTN